MEKFKNFAHWIDEEFIPALIVTAIALFGIAVIVFIMVAIKELIHILI